MKFLSPLFRFQSRRWITRNQEQRLHHKEGTVYKIYCKDFNAAYIGKTNRHLNVSVTEYKQILIHNHTRQSSYHSTKSTKMIHFNGMSKFLVKNINSEKPIFRNYIYPSAKLHMTHHWSSSGKSMPECRPQVLRYYRNVNYGLLLSASACQISGCRYWVNAILQ